MLNSISLLNTFTLLRIVFGISRGMFQKSEFFTLCFVYKCFDSRQEHGNDLGKTDFLLYRSSPWFWRAKGLGPSLTEFVHTFYFCLVITDSLW